MRKHFRGADAYDLLSHEMMHDILLQSTNLGLLNSVLSYLRSHLDYRQAEPLLSQVIRSTFEVQEGCATIASWVVEPITEPATTLGVYCFATLCLSGFSEENFLGG